MNWLQRLKRTPWSFQALVLFLLADWLLSAAFLIPGLYERGFSHVGNLWWGPLVLFFFLFPDNARGITVIRCFAVALAMIATIDTVSIHAVNSRAHADYPSNPSFYFNWFNWVDGLVFPWLVAAICCLLPRISFPLRPLDKPAA